MWCKIKFTAVKLEYEGLDIPLKELWTDILEVPKSLEEGLCKAVDEKTYDNLSVYDNKTIVNMLEQWYKSTHKPWRGTIQTEIKGIYKYVLKKTDNQLKIKWPSNSKCANLKWYHKLWVKCTNRGIE